jgi:hypothetical protein
MNKILLISCIFFINTSFAECTKETKTEKFIFSENGESIISYHSNGNCFKSITLNGANQYYEIDGIGKNSEFNRQISLEISKNSKLLLVGLNNSESTRIYLLRDLKDFSQINSFPAIEAKFREDSNEIIFIPDYIDVIGQKTFGLKIHDLRTKKTKHKFKELIFSGQITLKGKFAIAEIMENSEIDSKRKFIILNIDEETWQKIE